MLTNMNYEERERLAYAEGYPEAARLLAQISEMEHAATVLLRYLDLYAPDNLGDEIYGAIDQLRGLVP